MSLRANCPNCGGPIEFLWSSAVQTTCPYCRSILVRHDVDLERVGQVGDLPASESPIQIGTEGRYRGRAFLVVGRIIYEYERGAWSEWHLVFADGKAPVSGWLSDAQAEYAVTTLATPDRPLPPPERVTRGSRHTLLGAAYEVSVITRARYRGVEGELPFEYWDKREVPFADLRAPNGGFATIDYSEEPPLLYTGEYVDFAALELRNLRAEMPAAAARVRSKGLNCPSCGAAVELRAGAHTQTVACATCLAVLDARDPNLRVLQTFAKKVRVQPKIPLGTRGAIRGAEYAVIGFQVRTIRVDGTPYSWHEYVLYNPEQGFRYLSEYDGHWNDIVPLKTLPEPTSADGRKAMKLHGETFRHFQTAEAETTFVLGEFPWEVRVGDRVSATDFVAPPRVLSSETTSEETTWSLGEYTGGARIWQTFRLPGRPPMPRGVYANQPSPYAGRAGAMWSLFGVLALALVALLVARFMTAGNQRVFSQTYRWRPGDTTAFVTEPFTLGGRTSNVLVEIESDVSNEWLFLDLALIDEGSGATREIGREVSYYTGRDEDGAWHEGSARDRAIIAAVPPGRYFLRVQPEGAPPVPASFRASGDMAGTRAIDYRIRLRRDVPSAKFFALALLLLVVPPVFVSLRSASFEYTRWQESDHASATASGLMEMVSDDE